ncbi:TORTIFOLIA1-like protein 3 isoform X1 [Rhodamnia argentea]|uniref:TORTIFOLIA1-like protein 3 isoform X1 n=1 Tax=Rhodamnia argentea TaxID=178133 RepID=A0A8B8NHD8_9MYRT|nr:TORTIFOLIA1-like protein 3 isoform X1 [Rhodamnia argentea]
MPAYTPPQPLQNLKQRVLTCITKLADRDTHSIASSELDSIARSLDPASFSAFISCINSTDASDKSPVRKQCVSLLTTLSVTHGNTLSPHLPKMISGITRRLRDPDSAVRSGCVSATAALATNVNKPSFDSFLKAFSDALFTEQDVNAQMSAALCLASAINASPDPEPAKLCRLLPRFERLLKADAFRANSAALTLIESVVGVGAARSEAVLKNLVPCVLGFLSGEDWAARKASAEVLLKLAVVERDLLVEFKPACLKVFENRRFDKVKAVREVMNQTVEAWKLIPDLSEEVSTPLQSVSSSKENASDGRYPSTSRTLSSSGSVGPQMRKKPTPPSRPTALTGSSASASTLRKRSPLKSSNRNVSPILRKVDHKKPSDWKVEIAISRSTLSKGTGGDDLRETNENIPQRKSSEIYEVSKPETKRALFSKNSDENLPKPSGFRSGSRVVPCPEGRSDFTLVASNAAEDHHRNHKDSEDLSLIRNQLVQIEQQQSSLLDLLQRFIGSSQNGMRSLETRVHGLEMALDEISYDLALTSGRMTSTNSKRTSCCMLPTDFLSSRFRRKPEGRYSSSRFISSDTPSVSSTRFRTDRSCDNGVCNLENRRFRQQGGAGFMVNPLAKIHTENRSIPEMVQ